MGAGQMGAGQMGGQGAFTLINGMDISGMNGMQGMLPFPFFPPFGCEIDCHPFPQIQVIATQTQQIPQPLPSPPPPPPTSK